MNENKPIDAPSSDSPALPAGNRLDTRPESANTRETPPKYNRLADIPGLREAFDEIQAQYRTDEIIALNDEILESLRTSLEKAIELGRLLTIQNAKLKHGEWLPFVDTLPFSRKTADNYRHLYENRAKFVNVTNLTEAYRLIAEEREERKGQTEPTIELQVTGDDEIENDEPDSEPAGGGIDGGEETGDGGEGRAETRRKNTDDTNDTEPAETEDTPERGANLADIREVKLQFTKADVEEFNRQIKFIKKAGAGDNPTDIVAQLVQREAESLGYDVPETILEPERGEDGLIIADNQRTRAFGAKQDTIDYLIRCRLMNIGKDNPHRAEAFNGIIRWLVIQREQANG